MKYTYTVQSEMQCHHRCLGKPKCEVLNYQNNGKDNCEVFDAEIGDYNNFCAKSTSSHLKWKSVILKVKIAMDFLHHLIDQGKV